LEHEASQQDTRAHIIAAAIVIKEIGVSMHRATPLDASNRGYVSGGARGVVHEADDKQFMQEIKADFMTGEMREHIEHPQNYGFSSFVRKGEVKKEEAIRGAEHFTHFIGGSRTFPVTLTLDDRRYRLWNLDEGEVTVFDDQQQKIHIQRQRIYTRSQYKVEMRVIKDDPKGAGYGSDEPTSRDQKKDASTRLSTIVFDKDTITVERTKPKDDQQQSQGQQGQGQGQNGSGGGSSGSSENGVKQGDDKPADKQADDPEVVHLSQVQLQETKIIITTFKEDQPHLVITWDEEQESLTLKTTNTAITMQDKDSDQITVAAKQAIYSRTPPPQDENDTTPPKTWIKQDNTSGSENIKIAAAKKVTLRTPEDPAQPPKTAVECDDQAGVVKVGDLQANVPIALLGSITSKGDRIVGKVSLKALSNAGYSGSGGGAGGAAGGPPPVIPPSAAHPPVVA
jgi:phage gp45-like